MNKKGFTFIEVMVVVMILGILATFIVPKIIGKPDEARVAKAKSEIKSIESALKMYRMDNSNYPTTEQGLDALFKKTDIEPIPRNWKKGGYIEATETPKDPWGNYYIYRSPGENDRDYEIISLGADGKEGGEGVNADIKSYEIK
jgi:general secretion pathway protein G